MFIVIGYKFDIIIDDFCFFGNDGFLSKNDFIFEFLDVYLKEFIYVFDYWAGFFGFIN